MYYVWLPRLKAVLAVAGFFIFIVTAGFLGEVYRIYMLSVTSRGDDVRNVLGAFFAGLLWCSTLLAVGYGRLFFKNENGWPRFVLNFCLVMLMWPFYIITGIGHIVASFLEDTSYNIPRIDAFVESIKNPPFIYGIYTLPLPAFLAFVMALTLHSLVMPYNVATASTSLDLPTDAGLAWIVLKSLHLVVAYTVPPFKMLIAGKRQEMFDVVAVYTAAMTNARLIVQLRVQVYLSKVRHVWLINLGVRINESIGLIGDETKRKRELLERVNIVMRDQAAAKDDLDSSTRALIEETMKEERITRDLESILEKVAHVLFDYFDDDTDTDRPDEMTLVN
jgi:hypothetical protein